jgi:crotonobetainyl-CoA:carnitine CoA-transferase CaiB-like acyl-CoA transferase
MSPDETTTAGGTGSVPMSLAHVRVLDLTNEMGQLAGRMLADLGADVIKVEPPGGDPSRGIAPFLGDEPHPERSLHWWMFNASKRSVTLDLGSDAGCAQFLDLVRRSDIVLESAPPGAMAALGLGYEDLAEVRQSLVMTSITPFGQDGPYSGWKSSDLVGAAMGGQMSLNGDLAREPLRPTISQAFAHASVQAVVGTLIANFHRTRTGEGQHVDASLQEAAATWIDNAMPFWEIMGINLPRPGVGRSTGGQLSGRYVFEAADGYMTALSFGGLFGLNAQQTIAWLASHDAAADLDDEVWLEKLDTSRGIRAPLSPEDQAHLVEVLAAFCRRFPRLQLMHEAQAIRNGWAPVHTPRDLLENEHLLGRGFWQEVEHPELGRSFTYPGAWARLSATPLRAPRRAPLVGEHQDEVFEELAAAPVEDASPTRRVVAMGGGAGSAFDGIRVADFAWVGVGPLASKYLSDHGAEVIRLESSTRPETLRRAPPFVDGVPGQERSGYYANFNSSKLGAGLNMSHPRAVEIAKRLVAECDIVTESFTPRAMRKWGLTYEELREVRPDLIMISMPLYGSTGPWAMYQGYGHVLQAASGISHMTGYRDGEPIGAGYAYTDFFVPHLAAAALIAALDHRERTGEGQHIDFAQIEAAIYATETMSLDYTVNGREQHRDGNRHPQAAPHGAFRCAAEDDDDDRWVAIACTDDAEWAALCGVLQADDLRDDARFATLADRKTNEDALEAEVGDRTRDHSARDLMVALQEAGVAAGMVQRPSDLFEDPQMTHRGHYWFLDHPEMGRRAYDGPSFRLSRTPTVLTKAAPMLGADTEYVFRQIMGLDEEEFIELLASGAFE